MIMMVTMKVLYCRDVRLIVQCIILILNGQNKCWM